MTRKGPKESRKFVSMYRFLPALAILAYILIEPRYGLLEPVDLVLRVDKHMTFAGINDQLCLYA